MAAAVVADDAANVFGDGGQVADQVVNGLGGQIGVVGQGGVHVVDVGLVVLVVVELHGLGVDEGFERGVVVGKRCEVRKPSGKSPSFGLCFANRGQRSTKQRTYGPGGTIAGTVASVVPAAAPYVWMRK